MPVGIASRGAGWMGRCGPAVGRVRQPDARRCERAARGEAPERGDLEDHEDPLGAIEALCAEPGPWWPGMSMNSTTRRRPKEIRKLSEVQAISKELYNWLLQEKYAATWTQKGS